MSSIPQLPVATAPTPQKATEVRSGSRKAESGFASVLSTAIPQEKQLQQSPSQPKVQVADASSSNGKRDVEGAEGQEAPVVVSVAAETHAKTTKPGFLAAVESVDVVASLPVASASEEEGEVHAVSPTLAPAKNEQQGQAASAAVAVDSEYVVSDSEAVKPLDTKEQPDFAQVLETEKVPVEEKRLAPRPQVVTGDVDGGDKPKLARDAQLPVEKSAIAQITEPVVESSVATLAAVRNPEAALPTVTTPIETVPTPERPKAAVPQAVSTPRAPVVPVGRTSAGTPIVESDSAPVVHVATRLDAHPPVTEADETVLRLTNTPAAQAPTPPVVAETVVARQIAATTAGAVRHTPQVRSADVVVDDQPVPRIETKADAPNKPMAETQPVTLGTQDQAEPEPAPERGRELEVGTKQQPKADSVPSVAMPNGASEIANPELSTAKQKAATPTAMAALPVASGTVQAVADVSSRPLIPLSQPVVDTAPPRTPLAEEPALNAQLQQLASQKTLNVVMHDDRLGRVALQLIERGGWVETAIRTSDPRGSQILSNATAGLIETLQQRGVTAMAAGESAAWDAQEGQRRDNPHRDQDPQRRRLRVRRQGQEFIGALAQAAS